MNVYDAKKIDKFNGINDFLFERWLFEKKDISSWLIFFTSLHLFLPKSAFWSALKIESCFVDMTQIIRPRWELNAEPSRATGSNISENRWKVPWILSINFPMIFTNACVSCDQYSQLLFWNCQVFNNEIVYQNG